MPPPGRSISAGGSALVGCAADPSDPPRRHGPQAATVITSSHRPLDPWLRRPSSSSGTASPWARRRACPTSASSLLRHRIRTRCPFCATSRRPPLTSAAAPLLLSASAWLQRKPWGRQATAPSGPSGHRTAGRRRRRAAAPLHRRLSPLRRQACIPFVLSAASTAALRVRTRLRWRFGGCQPAASLELGTRLASSPPSAMPLSPSLSF